MAPPCMCSGRRSWGRTKLGGTSVRPRLVGKEEQEQGVECEKANEEEMTGGREVDERT